MHNYTNNTNEKALRDRGLVKEGDRYTTHRLRPHSPSCQIVEVGGWVRYISRK